MKVTINGYAKPQWFVATPIEVQPEGGVSSICVKNTGDTDARGSTSECDSPYHLVTSGVSIMAWGGGNMPENEDLLYNYVYKKSSFTVLAFTILTFALTWGLASAFTTVVGGTAGVGAGGLHPLAVGAIGAGIYAGAFTLQGAGITDSQGGWAGSTGNGVLKPDQGSLDRHNQGLNQAIKNRQINSRVGTGLSGVQTLYRGNCPEDWSVAMCVADGRDPGTMHRTDAYRESNVVIQMREAEERCKALGFEGKQLAQCAAPAAGVWTIETGL